VTWRAVRVLAGVAVLATVLGVVGPGAVPAALGSLDAGSLATAALIGAVTTTCAAWRWQVVAGRLGIRLPLAPAVVACYRAQFLNATLPGGVLGDVQRGVGHGRAVGRPGTGLRAVAWERTCGFVVLAALAAPVVLLAPARADVPAGAGAVALLAVVVGGGVAVTGRGRAVVLRVVAGAAADARALAAPRAATVVGVTSVLVVAGHVATFGVAAHAVGIPLGPAGLVSVALPVLLLGALPTNVAGWGPREGAAAWVFAGAGAGASQGVAVAVAYGAIALVATLPGALLLATAAVRAPGERRAGSPSRSAPSRLVARRGGAADA
jgi:hypothetical protein